MALLLNFIKSIAKPIQEKFPKTYGYISLVRNNWKLKRISQRFVARYGASVLAGPFAGLSYISRSVGSSLTPKLLGCYEKELHEVLEYITNINYSEIVDIGCAEGYYAVGLAVRIPASIIYAFDIDLVAQQLCKELAQLNGVRERVIVRGNCRLETLQELPLDKALIVCDCEGYELQVLQPDLAPILRYCDILVELHDFINPSISNTILNRFAQTHDIQLIKSTSRNPTVYPVLDFLSEEERRLAVAEFRPEKMQWAFMRVKANGTDLRKP